MYYTIFLICVNLSLDFPTLFQRYFACLLKSILMQPFVFFCDVVVCQCRSLLMFSGCYVDLGLFFPCFLQDVVLTFVVLNSQFLQLHLDPASSNTLPATGNGSITQNLRVTNSQHGKVFASLEPGLHDNAYYFSVCCLNNLLFS